MREFQGKTFSLLHKLSGIKIDLFLNIYKTKNKNDYNII